MMTHASTHSSSLCGGRHPPRRIPGKTVYILGAGFSVPAGLPVMSGFAPRVWRYLKALRKTKASGDLERVLTKLALTARATDLDLENLEHLYCLAEHAAYRDPENKTDRESLHSIIVEALWPVCKQCPVINETDSIRIDNGRKPGKRCSAREYRLVPHRFLHNGTPEGVTIEPVEQFCMNVCVYHAFLSQVLSDQRSHDNPDELDVIITFNYDLIIERAIRAFKGSSVFYGKDIVQNGCALPRWVIGKLSKDAKLLRRTLPLLKIHGSLNWQCAPDRKKVNRILTDEKLASRPPVRKIPLIPPTLFRDGGSDTIFARLLTQAVHHLQRADKIVVIGYSFPKTDHHIRYTLAFGMITQPMPQLEIWDVKDQQQMMSRLAEMIGANNMESGRISYHSGGLAGFVRKTSDPLLCPD